MNKFGVAVSFLVSAALAFAVALLLLGPATQHAQAGPITHALYVLVLLAGFVSLGLGLAGFVSRRVR